MSHLHKTFWSELATWLHLTSEREHASQLPVPEGKNNGEKHQCLPHLATPCHTSLCLSEFVVLCLMAHLLSAYFLFPVGLVPICILVVLTATKEMKLLEKAI